MVYIKEWGAAYIKREWEQYISRRRGDNTYQEGVVSIIYQGGEGGHLISSSGEQYISRRSGGYLISSSGEQYISRSG